MVANCLLHFSFTDRHSLEVSKLRLRWRHAWRNWRKRTEDAPRLVEGNTTWWFLFLKAYSCSRMSLFFLNFKLLRNYFSCYTSRVTHSLRCLYFCCLHDRMIGYQSWKRNPNFNHFVRTLILTPMYWCKTYVFQIEQISSGQELYTPEEYFLRTLLGTETATTSVFFWMVSGTYSVRTFSLQYFYFCTESAII